MPRKPKTPASKPKPSGKSSDRPLEPQPHGGALTRNAGGNHGGGRPRSALRHRAFSSFEERLTVLEAIADSQTASDGDRIRAVDTLGKYGVGALKEMSVDVVKDRLEATMEAIKARTSPEQFASIVDAVEDVWRHS